MKQELFHILLILAIIALIIIYYLRYVKMGMGMGMGMGTGTGTGIREGLVNNTSPKALAEELKLKVDQLKAGMNIDTHRTDYEDIIIHLEDIISHSMLKAVSVMKTDHDDPIKIANNMEVLNQLNTSKTSLNDLMGWLDKQK